MKLFYCNVVNFQAPSYLIKTSVNHLNTSEKTLTLSGWKWKAISYIFFLRFRDDFHVTIVILKCAQLQKPCHIVMCFIMRFIILIWHVGTFLSLLFYSEMKFITALVCSGAFQNFQCHGWDKHRICIRCRPLTLKIRWSFLCF